MKRKTKNNSGNQALNNTTRLFVLAVTLGLMYFLWRERESIQNLSKLGYLGVFMVNFISNATVIFPLPGTLGAFFGGVLWNPLLVGIFSGIGSTLGELFGYFLGFGGRGLINKYERKNRHLVLVEEFFRKKAFVTIFLLSLVPFPFFDFVGILAGGISYPVWKFVIATASGRIIRDVILALSGARML